MKLLDFNEKEITIEMSVDEYTTISAALGSASVYMGDGNNVKKIAQEFKMKLHEEILGLSKFVDDEYEVE